MSALKNVIAAVRRLPRGYSADGRSLGLGLAAALDAQRARGAEPMTPEAPSADRTAERRAKVA